MSKFTTAWQHVIDIHFPDLAGFFRQGRRLLIDLISGDPKIRPQLLSTVSLASRDQLRWRLVGLKDRHQRSHGDMTRKLGHFRNKLI